MKNYLFLILILFSCRQPGQKASEESPTTAPAVPPPPSHKEDSILINIMHGGEDIKLDSCVYVSYDLEKDSTYNRMLRLFLCNNLFGHSDYPAQDSLPMVVNRESFLRMILLFYDGEKYSRVRTGIEKYRLNDLRQEYLATIRDCCVDRFQIISDSLLRRDYFDGAEILWEKADLAKLPSLKGYLDRMDTSNFTYDARAAAFLHVAGNDSLSQVYMAISSRRPDSKSEYRKLKVLMKKPTFGEGEYEKAILGDQY